MKVILIRHTQVGVDRGICYGASDIPLAETFEGEAETVLEKVASFRQEGWTRVYSSPLSRCSLLADKVGDSPIIDPRLKEYDFGDWELMPWREIKGDAADAWFKDFTTTKSPNGEAFIDLYHRAASFWDEVILPQRSISDSLSRDERYRIAIVTHAGPIRALLSHLVGLPLDKAFNVSIDKGGCVELTVRQSHVQVERINF